MFVICNNYSFFFSNKKLIANIDKIGCKSYCNYLYEKASTVLYCLLHMNVFLLLALSFAVNSYILSRCYYCNPFAVPFTLTPHFDSLWYNLKRNIELSFIMNYLLLILQRNDFCRSFGILCWNDVITHFY